MAFKKEKNKKKKNFSVPQGPINNDGSEDGENEDDDEEGDDS